MQPKNTLDYYDLNDLFFENEVVAPASEIHAVLCGLICAGISTKDKTWLAALIELCNDGHELPEPTANATALFVQQIEQQFQEKQSISPLLPSDEMPLEERLEALAEWTQAFLAGFGSLTKLEDVSSELQEMISDLASIACLSHELDPEDADNENAYTLLYEHVCLGAMLAYEECAK